VLFRSAFLDSTLDRVTDAALFSAVIIYYANIDSWYLYPALIAGVSAQLTSYVKAKAESLDIIINSGIAERAERIILLLVGTGFQALGLDFALNIAILTLAVLSTITVLQRLVVAYQSEQLK
jgi:CDP-diacylglycerol--glycerol-3-phosphate 3-phosphatidyltransferase